MKKWSKYGLWGLCLLLLVTCQQVVDLDAPIQGGQLVVFGRISNSTQGNYVSVHRTSYSGQEPDPVVNARVFVTGSAGFEEELIMGDSGIYELRRNDITGTVGEEYTLRVTMGTMEYTTAPQKILPMVGTDSISWELDVFETITSAGELIREDVVNVFVSTRFDELPESFYLRWDTEEAYTYLGTYLPANWFPPGAPPPQCYVVNELNEQEVFLHNGAVNRASYIPPQHLITRRVDKTFQAKHYFNFIKSSISQETYTYWSRLDGVVNRQGSIFDVPPAAVEGNIISNTGETVLGYFEAVSIDTSRVFLTHNDVPIWAFDECVKKGDGLAEMYTVPMGCRQCLIDRGIVEPHCFNCNVLRGSSYTRPSYF